MTDAPALPSLQDDATVTPRTDREVYTIRQQDIGFEAVGATLARTLERELAAAIADRNALQLALNAANGRADGLEVASRDTFRFVAVMLKRMGAEIIIEPSDILTIERHALVRTTLADGRILFSLLADPQPDTKGQRIEEPRNG